MTAFVFNIAEAVIHLDFLAVNFGEVVIALGERGIAVDDDTFIVEAHLRKWSQREAFILLVPCRSRNRIVLLL